MTVAAAWSMHSGNAMNDQLENLNIEELRTVTGGIGDGGGAGGAAGGSGRTRAGSRASGGAGAGGGAGGKGGAGGE